LACLGLPLWLKLAVQGEGTELVGRLMGLEEVFIPAVAMAKGTTGTLKDNPARI
jgi:hypothetical protein